MSDSKDFNTKAYDLWAGQYDQELNSTIAVDDLHFPTLWRDLSKKTVLEIGCGTGRHTHRLVAAGNRVTAIDASEGMLDLARSKVPPGNVQFIHADFLSETQLPRSAFDVVLESLVLEHVEDLAAFFLKVAGHLTKNGHLYISEIHPDRIAGGSQANFVDTKTGEIVKLKSFAHPAEAFVECAAAAGLTLFESREIFGDSDLARKNASWSKYLGRPMVQMWRFVACRK